MRATKKEEKINLCDKLTVDTQGLQNLLDCGRVTAVEIGSLAGARIEMGKRVLWNVNKVRQYLNAISTE